MKELRRWLLTVLVLALLACTSVTGLMRGATPTAAPTAKPRATVTLAPASPRPPTAEPTGTAGTPAEWPPSPADAPGGMVAGPAGDAERAAAAALAETDYPLADFVALAESLGGVPGPISRVVATTPADWKVGDRADFWVQNQDTIEFGAVSMELRAIGQHAYLWFDRDVLVSDAEARQAAAVFDDVYTRDRDRFGTEPNPGIDGDPRVYILHTSSARMGSGAGGYQDDSSELPKAAFTHSNEHELFVMNTDYLTPGSGGYAGTLAHEFQHMIHGNYDPSDEDWVLEGSAVYAEDALDFQGDPQGYSASYLVEPDALLNAGVGTVDYGYGFLFVRYVASRFAPDFVRDWLQRPEDGLRGLDAALKAAGENVTSTDVLEGWVVANLIGGNARAPREYQYDRLDFSPVTPAPLGSLPATLQTTVNQHAADYYSLEAARDLQVEFNGSTKVRPIPASPHSGDHYWWSGRSNKSDITLTHEVDLSGVSTATLHYWAWFDIEEGWDYGYVVVSTDGGKTWQGLATPAMTNYDPQKRTYTERFYTGNSGGAWVEEKADLTPFARKKILLRFEYITDAEVTQSGLAVDDLSIPEINYYDDAETDGGWQAAGFNRVTAYLPQEWSLQLVTVAGGVPQVQAIQLTDGTHASFDAPASSKAVLIVTALAPTTIEPATYELSVK